MAFTLAPEDKVLVIGATAGILAVLGGVFSGDVRYAELGVFLLGLSSVFKGLLPAPKA